MGRRSRKSGRAPARAVATPKPPSRSEAREAAVRAQLEPYPPGERPTVLTVAAVVAALLALTNIVLPLAGYHLKSGKGNATVGTVAFAVLMLAMAWGLLRMRYWAVLGFQALLAIAVLVFALFLIRASNLLAVVVCLAVITLGGFLFYKMIRVMARVQMPSRTPPGP